MPRKDTKLMELALRCGEAAGVDWQLSVDIFRQIGLPETWFGSKVENWFGNGPFGCNTVDGLRHLDCVNAPSYTGSIDAALTIVPPEHWWSIEQTAAPDSPLRNFGARRGLYLAKVFAWKGPGDTATHDLPALAICAAALKARAICL